MQGIKILTLRITEAEYQTLTDLKHAIRFGALTNKQFWGRVVTWEELIHFLTMFTSDELLKREYDITQASKQAIPTQAPKASKHAIRRDHAKASKQVKHKR